MIVSRKEPLMMRPPSLWTWFHLKTSEHTLRVLTIRNTNFIFRCHIFRSESSHPCDTFKYPFILLYPFIVFDAFSK